MPGPIIPSGATQALVAWRGTGGQGPYVVTYGIATGAPTVAMANAIMAIWVARWQVGVPNTLRLTDVQLWGGPSGGLTIVTSTSAPNTGASAVNSLPPNCSLIMRKATATGGRRGRGRSHLPGVLDTNVDDFGFVTSAAVTTYNGRLANILADHAAGGFAMTLLHSSGSTTPTAITGLTCGPKVGTVRKRL